MFATALRRNRRLFGDHRGCHVGDQFLGWASLVEQGERLAVALAARGLVPGDRLAAVLPNGAPLLILFACACLSGLVIVPLNFRWTADEIADALEDCGAAAIFTDDEYRGLAQTATQRSGTAILDVAALIGRAGLNDAQPVWPALAPTTLMAIFYTGGTTGRPKGVMLSQANIGYSAMSHVSAGLFGEHETVLHVSPAFHIAGAISIFCTFLSGGAGVMMSGFDPDQALGLIESRKVTQALLVPTMIRMLLDSPSLVQTDVASMNDISYGAAPMPLPLLERARAAFSHAAFTQLYGMTETAPTSCVLRPRDYCVELGDPERIRSVGRPFPGTEIRVVDAAGDEVERGVVGEICTRGPGVMMGYWNKPEQTSEALRQGWMHTGDGGCMDEDGFIYLADRLKDMIITGGENVYSVEVENVLSAHPTVRQCAVVGVPDPKWGEAVHAVTVLHEGAFTTQAELIAFCRDRLAAFKAPKAITFWSGGLPASAAGKILKGDLRVALAEMLRGAGPTLGEAGSGSESMPA